MKTRLLALLVIISVFLGSTNGVGALSQANVAEDWEPVSTGIQYREFSLAGPMRVYVARMERSNERVTLDSSLGQGKVAYGLESVSAMAKRYDQAVTWWGDAWGARSRVVVAINGSFIESSGAPQNGQVQAGWYLKRFNDLGGSTGFAWTADRRAFVGGCPFHRPEKQLITFQNGAQMLLEGVNIPRAEGELVIYTPQYDDDTNTNSAGVEVLVEMSKPLMILPPPASAEGVVRQIRDGAGSTPIPFDHIVLSASGGARTALLGNLQVGERVQISQEVTHFERNCSTPNPNSWTKTYATVSGSFVFLKEGEAYHYDDPGATARHPRTAIAYDDMYIYFIVVDGRNEQHSIGMTIDELAFFTREYLGASWGVAQDGGGSSTMVINGEVKNKPAVPCYRMYVPLVQSPRLEEPPELFSRQISRAQDPVFAPVCERNVANGMLMVVIEDMDQSDTFSPGFEVSTRGDARLRLGPGTQYGIFAEIPAYTRGIVLDHPVQGVFAKGDYWWKVNLGGLVGWLPGQSMTLYQAMRDTQYRQP